MCTKLPAIDGAVVVLVELPESVPELVILQLFSVLREHLTKD